jgi:uncharacterized protein YndB with AHSA1/START domain
MKYSIELMINRPRREVWQAFQDPEKAKLWRPSLTGVELLTGTTGEAGAKSKLTFTEGKREFSLVERITVCQEPERLDQMYENEFSVNTVQNSFLEQGQAQTPWITETEYLFKTLLMKIMGPVYKKNLVTRTQREMERFKEMVEKEYSLSGTASQTHE